MVVYNTVGEPDKVYANLVLIEESVHLDLDLFGSVFDPPSQEYSAIYVTTTLLIRLTFESELVVDQQLQSSLPAVEAGAQERLRDLIRALTHVLDTGLASGQQETQEVSIQSHKITSVGNVPKPVSLLILG